MDTPTPLGRYLGCEHLSKQSSLGRADHPFAHVFDKSLPDPSAKKAAAAAVQDFNEYYPDEGIVARHHLQPRKALYRPSGEESQALDLGAFRCTDSKPVSGGEYNESWDDSGQGRRLPDLWTGATYLASKEHTLASAMAAIKKIKNRNKNDAKKQARAQSFYDVNQLSDKDACTNPLKKSSMT